MYLASFPSKQCRIRSGSVLVAASYGRYGQRAARIETDRICRIRLPASVLVPFFQRRPGPYCAQPTRIRSRWPGQVLAKRTRSSSKSTCCGIFGLRAYIVAGDDIIMSTFTAHDYCRRQISSLTAIYADFKAQIVPGT